MNKPTQRRYFDPYAKAAEPRWQEFAAAIDEYKKVVLQKDGPTKTQDVFERLGYLGVFAVSEVVFKEGELSFRFLDRIYDVKD